MNRALRRHPVARLAFIAWFLLPFSYLFLSFDVDHRHGMARAETRTIVIDTKEGVSAAEFIESIGINTHFSFLDTPYATRYREVQAKLLRLGIHHVRDLLNTHVEELGRQGIKTTVLAEPNGGTPQVFAARIKALNATARVVDVVEGANEPDMFWKRLGITWRGEGYPLGPVLWQRDLFAAFKADPALASVKIVGPSLGLAGMPNASPPSAWDGLRQFVDDGDFHPYPYNGNPFGPDFSYGGLRSFFHDGTFPSVYISPEAADAYRAYRSIYGPGPMMATEAGYPTGPHFTSEALQAKYLPRMFAEFFRLGIKRTYLYQLVDSVEDPTGDDPDASFGLLRHDLSERPSYQAIVRLIDGVARAPRPGSAPPTDLTLTLTLAGIGAFWDPGRVHRLLIRREDGTLVLLLWQEVSGEDASVTPRRAIAVPAMQAQLAADRPVHFTVTDSSTAAADAVALPVSDSLLAIEITK